jgi:hypothetical protein
MNNDTDIVVSPRPVISTQGTSWVVHDHECGLDIDIFYSIEDASKCALELLCDYHYDIPE